MRRHHALEFRPLRGRCRPEAGAPSRPRLREICIYTATGRRSKRAEFRADTSRPHDREAVHIPHRCQETPTFTQLGDTYFYALVVLQHVHFGAGSHEAEGAQRGSHANRLSLSRGAPSADPRYRGELNQQTPVIEGSSAGRPPLSRGAPPADPRYRGELHRQTPVIEGSSASRSPLSRGAPPVKRHELLRSWETPTFTHRCSAVRGPFRVREPRSGGSGATGATRLPDPKRALDPGGLRRVR